MSHLVERKNSPPTSTPSQTATELRRICKTEVRKTAISGMKQMLTPIVR
jgi:hypothetical protein